jgi:hypothetical protein
MILQQRLAVAILTVAMGLAGMGAQEQLTTPKESLSGLRPGTLTLGQLQDKMGKPDVSDQGGLLGLYGGSTTSEIYGWYMVENPNYTIPDLAVETAKDSDRIDLVMSIGYEGLKTEKGVGCFDSQDDVLKAYGKPDFAFAVPMNGIVLRELYYPKLGLSFDVAPLGPNADLEVVAIYITYPEYMQRAIEIRHKYIADGTGKDITYVFDGGTAT